MLRVFRLVWVGMFGCVRVFSLVLKRLGVWEWLGLFVVIWMDLFLLCLYSLMLVVLLLLLLIWKLCWKVYRCSLGWLFSKVGGWGVGWVVEG